MSAAPPSPRGVLGRADDARRRGLYLHKTLWAISRRARGDVLITASDHRTGDSVSFFDGRVRHRILRLPRPRAAWGYVTTTPLLPGPGCYEFGVTGRALDQRIVFQATLRRSP